MSGGSDVSPRHKIDAIRALDGMAANGPAAPPTADRFLIQINMGADTLTFNKSILPLEPGEKFCQIWRPDFYYVEKVSKAVCPKP